MGESIVVFMEAGARWPAFIPTTGEVRAIRQHLDEPTDAFTRRVEELSFDEPTLRTSKVFYVAYGLGSPGSAAARHAALSALVLRIDSEAGGAMVLVGEGHREECRSLANLALSLNDELSNLGLPECLRFRAQPTKARAARPSLNPPKRG